MIGEVTIATPHGEMPSYVAAPSRPARWPGVVVIHDFTGMSQDLRNQADWLANEGFLAAAPDLYYWGSRLRWLRTIMRDISARRGRTFDDMDAARVSLAARRAAPARSASRLLHGRRLRAGARARSRVLREQRQLRWIPKDA